MKYNYSVEITLDDRSVRNTTFGTVAEAMGAAKKAVVDYGGKLRVNEYISRIRKGINKGYRALVADYWAEFFSSPTFNVMTRVAPFEEDPEDYEEKIEEVEADWDDEDYEYEEPPKDPLDDFYCGNQEFDMTEFYFGRRLHMETNWLRASYHASSPERFFDNFEMEAFEYDSQLVFDMSTWDHRVVVTVSRIQKTTHSENIVMVYEELNEFPKSRESLQESIWYCYHVKISLKTIGKHLDTLRKLGVPVAHRGINKYTLDLVHGYYLDDNMHCDMNRDEVAALGTSVNCILVLFALQQASGPMRQADIIHWIEKNYGVKIGRVAVARQIESLTDMGSPIGRTKDGYTLKK